MGSGIGLRDLFSFKGDGKSLSRSDLLVLKYSRYYFFMALFQLFIVFTANITVATYGFATHGGNESEGTLMKEAWAMYSIIFIVVVFHQFWLVWDGIRHTNIIEIFGFVALNGLYIYYSILQVVDVFCYHKQRQDSMNMTVIRTMCVITLSTLCICFILGVYFTMGIANQYRWEMFKAAGNDEKLRTAWYGYLYFEFFLKLSLMFFFIYLLMIVNCLANYDSVIFWVCIGLFPSIIIIFICGHWMIFRENILGLFVYITFKVVTLGFTIMVEVSSLRQKPYLSTNNDFKESLNSIQDALMVSMGVFNSIALICNIVVALFCYRHFGEGIPEFVLKLEKKQMGSSFLKANRGFLDPKLHATGLRVDDSSAMATSSSTSGATTSHGTLPESTEDVHTPQLVSPELYPYHHSTPQLKIGYANRVRSPSFYLQAEYYKKDDLENNSPVTLKDIASRSAGLNSDDLSGERRVETV
eukprot:Nk52_evm7s210 gene=Nk52_evmTU7s210